VLSVDESGRLLLHADMLPARYAGLRDQVHDFLTGELDAGSFVPRCDSWLTGFDTQFSRRVRERGWIGATFPERYGGAGADPFARFVIAEELLAAGAPVAAHWIADRQSALSILRFGTEKQRQRYLPGIIRGELFFAIGMSEPDAGSDLAAVRIRAERGDGGWLVNGTKVWTSHAHHAHHMLTLVRTSPADAARRHAGLSQFIIDLASPGVRRRGADVAGEPRDDKHPLHRLTTRLWAWREEYGNHAIWSERLGSVLAGKDGLTLWQRLTR
jgi:acyl-CoA dehydrogenase